MADPVAELLELLFQLLQHFRLRRQQRRRRCLLLGPGGHQLDSWHESGWCRIRAGAGAAVILVPATIRIPVAINGMATMGKVGHARAHCGEIVRGDR